MANKGKVTNLDATPTQKGVATSNGGGGGEDKIIFLNSPQTVTAEDKTIYIVNSDDIIFQMPQTARLGFRFKSIGLRGCIKMIIYPDSDQILRWKDTDSKALFCDYGWADVSMLCYEENKKFKWLNYVYKNP